MNRLTVVASFFGLLSCFAALGQNQGQEKPKAAKETQVSKRIPQDEPILRPCQEDGKFESVGNRGRSAFGPCELSGRCQPIFSTVEKPGGGTEEVAYLPRCRCSPVEQERRRQQAEEAERQTARAREAQAASLEHETRLARARYELVAVQQMVRAAASNGCELLPHSDRQPIAREASVATQSPVHYLSTTPHQTRVDDPPVYGHSISNWNQIPPYSLGYRSPSVSYYSTPSATYTTSYRTIWVPH